MQDYAGKPIIIRPSRGWIPINWADLYEYRELLYFLTWRDLKIKYKQTLLGASWAVLQPLFMMFMFTIFFGRMAKVPSDGVPYPIFSYSGLVLWTYFAGALSMSSNSLVGGSHLISKIYFPRILMPTASTLAGLLDYLISLGVMILLMIWYHFTPGPGLLLLPLVVFGGFLAATGVGLWLSAMNVKYRDIRFVIPFLIQLWLFATPVIYPVTMLPEKYRWLLALNPMSGLVEAHRACLLGHQPIDWFSLQISFAIILLISVTGLYYFKRMERTFADVI